MRFEDKNIHEKNAAAFKCCHHVTRGIVVALDHVKYWKRVFIRSTVTHVAITKMLYIIFVITFAACWLTDLTKSPCFINLRKKKML